ncbi:hypothetical protein [Coralloluteibacterium thermophilus]|uniref:TonB-dependent receptor n=1 Tax=Coralloluteibacterium thermophilum TaxID=2707049 RepID=A0ABV9NL36_9GAMM
MKMKLLDYTLICLLGGALPAVAQARAPEAAPPAAIDCDAAACSDDGELLFRLRSRSYDAPVTRGTDAGSSAEALQPDRRAEVAFAAPGRAHASGTFSIHLPGGGVIWATEDPTLGRPELAVSAPTLVAYDGRAVVEPVRFFVRGNYPGFVERYEIAIYRGSDADLVDPLAVVPVPVAPVAQAEWDGALPARYRHRVGDALRYVLRAYDAHGRMDETHARTLQLVRPEDARRSATQLRERTERQLGTALGADEAQSQSMLDAVFAGNDLRQHNIPIHGSRIRIQGRDLPEGATLSINGERYPVDLERKFVAEYLAPVGVHRFDVAVEDRGGNAVRETLDVEVTGRYFFGVALADLTVHQNRIGGSAAPFANDARADDDILSDARLAFYLKAKTGGKYLVTAQADTTERATGDLFDGFFRADPQDVFRRLDPDLYYPVYGDDSTTWRDVDTMGRLYLRVDWDQNQALWGNFATGLTGTEYAQYVRSLYGAALAWRAPASNAWGDPRTSLRVFASEAQSAPGHSEFVGTGGSLYYLRHTDLLPGSDRVVLEVRDRTTGRVQNRVDLLRGADYEIDELQGRIILSRPLAQITRENVPTLTRDVPLDGYEQRLVVDYEWIPTGFDADEITAGLRGKHWFGDHLGVGATWVDENRAGEDYTLMSADVTLQAGRGTFLKVEHSRTEATGAPVFFSDNGGLSFTRLNPDGPREGEATAVEARANLRELGLTSLDWTGAAWWRRVDAGFSIARHDTGLGIEEVGAELAGQLTQDIDVHARWSRAERGADTLTQAQITGEWRISPDAALGAELRRVQEGRAGGDVAGLLGAVKYSQRVGDALDLYGIAQATLDDDGDAYRDNDALTAGARYLFGDQSSVGAEVTGGDRGDAARIDAEYRLRPEQTLYAGYTYSTDRTAYDPLFNPVSQNGWTLGQRWRLSNQVNLFNESQFLKAPTESGLAHTFGMDFYPAQGWNTGFTLQSGELVNAAGGEIDRRAISVGGGRTSARTDWQSRVEWRRDTGAERRTQWVTTNRLAHRVNESLRIAARLNYSKTEDEILAAAGARFVEGNLGFAWRPWDSTRWALFGRYTYLYDLASFGQIGGATVDQRSQILSFEGVYRAGRHWEFAGKLARREGEVRYERGTGPWFDSGTDFAAAQVRYELLQRWHALAEYRWLSVDDGGERAGWLVGVDRDIGRNFRIGAGYNFTDFSDDLTRFDYDHRGWFVNFTGRY